MEIGAEASIENESSTIGTDAGNAVHDQYCINQRIVSSAVILHCEQLPPLTPNVFQRVRDPKHFVIISAALLLARLPKQTVSPSRLKVADFRDAGKKFRGIA